MTKSTPIRNVYVEDGKHRYRIAFHGTRPVLVARQSPHPGGKERALDVAGPRSLSILSKARAKL